MKKIFFIVVITLSICCSCAKKSTAEVSNADTNYVKIDTISPVSVDSIK